MPLQGKLHNQEELLLQVMQGHEGAFRTMYDHYRDKIFAYALRHTKSKDTAQEVVQTVFIRLWEKRDQIDAGNNFEGYVMRITQHHILNLMRDTARYEEKRAHVYQQLEDLRNNPEEALFARELSRAYQEAIALLPPQKKIIYRLREEQALSHADIAARLQLSPHTVKKHMVEAVKFIRHYVSVHASTGSLVLAAFITDQLL